MSRKRVQLRTDVHSELRRRAEAESKPVTRILDAALRKVLGLGPEKRVTKGSERQVEMFNAKECP